MTRYNTIKNNFTKGELDPNFIGRIESEIYGQGCALLENMIPLPQGGAIKRPGSLVLDEVTNVAAASITSSTFRDFEIYPVQVTLNIAGTSGEARTKTILICISLKATGTQDGWMKFYETSGAAVSLTSSDYGRPRRNSPAVGGSFNPSNAAVYSNTNEEYLDFSYVQQNNFAFFTHKSGRMTPFMVVFDPTGGIWVTPITKYDLAFRVNLSPYFPLAIPYGGSTTDYKFNSNLVPFQPENISGVTFTPTSAPDPVGTIGNVITITASKAFFYDTTGGTYDQWVGSLISITQGSNTGVAEIISRTSNTVVSAAVVIPFSATTASTAWRVSYWNGYYGYPRAVTIHNQRLVWLGSPSFPDTLWNSEAGDIFHMRNFKFIQDATTEISGTGYFGPVVATDAFDFTLASNYRNDIRWGYSFDDLVVGTTQGTVKISTNGLPYAFNNVKASTQDGGGVGFCTPVQVNNVLFYTDITNQKLLFLEKNDNTGAYLTKDASALNYNITKAFHADDTDASPNKRSYWISQICLHEELKTVFLKLYNSDVLISFSFNPSADVSAWARHRLAPYGFANVKSICVAPSKTLTQQTIGITSLFLSVSRSSSSGVNNSYNIEQIATPLAHDSHIYIADGQTDFYINNGYQQSFGQFKPSINYMDGMNTTEDFTNSGAFPTTTSFLARRKTTSRIYDSANISVFVTSSIDANKLHYFGVLSTNSSGVATTPTAHGCDTGAASYIENSNIFYGFDYPSKIQLLPVEAGSNFGTRQGSVQRTHEIILRLRETRGFKIGKNFTSMIDFLDKYFPGASPTYSILSGDFKVAFPGNPDNDQMCLQHDIPFPFTIIAVILKGTAYD